jgi:cyanophycinase
MAEVPAGGVPHSGETGAAGARPLRPVYLLADSRLLFPHAGGEPLLALARRHLPPAPRAAYVGASNGDDPAFYAIFAAAAEAAGIAACRMIPSLPADEDRAFLEAADLVLLAGGDVERGWRTLVANGVGEAAVRRFRAGAVLVGVSAGAVQLGLLGWPEGEADPDAAFPTFGLVPFVVSVHDEASDWSALRRIVRSRGGGLEGLGIPAGGGAAVHPGGALEVLRRPACRLAVRGRWAAASLLDPADG